MKALKAFTLLALGFIVLPALIVSCKNDSSTKENKNEKAAINKEAASKIGFYETYLLKEVRDRLSPELVKAIGDNWGRDDYCVVAYINLTDTVAVNKALSESAPLQDMKLAWGVKTNKENKLELYALKTGADGKPYMSGEVITEASAEFEKYEGNTVSMRMNDDGARQWSEMTLCNIGRPIAIVFDNRVYSAPVVRQQIEGGSCEISGNFTEEETKTLVNLLYGR